jgi:hypothetical protein
MTLKGQRMKLLIKLVLCLSLPCGQAFSDDIGRMGLAPLKIAKDQKSPYSGYLINENILQQIEIDAQLKDRFKQDLIDCNLDLVTIRNEKDSESKWWLIGGMILGSMITMAVKR